MSQTTTSYASTSPPRRSEGSWVNMIEAQQAMKGQNQSFVESTGAKPSQRNSFLEEQMERKAGQSMTTIMAA